MTNERTVRIEATGLPESAQQEPTKALVEEALTQAGHSIAAALAAERGEDASDAIEDITVEAEVKVTGDGEIRIIVRVNF